MLVFFIKLKNILMNSACNSNNKIRVQTSFRQLLYIIEIISKNPQLAQLLPLDYYLFNIHNVGLTLANNGNITIEHIKIFFDISISIFNIIKIEKYPYNGDDAILEYALKNNCILATNDKELKKKAIKKGLPIIYLRKKRILEIGGINV